MSVSTASRMKVTKVSFEKDKLIAISSFGKCELRALTQTKLYCIDIEVALQFIRISTAVLSVSPLSGRTTTRGIKR